MMTLAGKTAFVLHASIVVGTARAGAIAVSTEKWELAATLWAITGVSLTALYREVSRAELDESHRQPPLWLTRLRGWRAARRMGSPESCSCETWWNTFGEAHSGQCPRGLAPRSDYLAGDDQ